MSTPKPPRNPAAKVRTNWKRFRALTDRQIRRGIAADPDAHPTTREFWKSARLVTPTTRHATPDILNE
ncbi:MAG: hypothetical protein ACLP59_33505 [Bryobacteraceae bacterium]